MAEFCLGLPLMLHGGFFVDEKHTLLPCGPSKANEFSESL